MQHYAMLMNSSTDVVAEEQVKSALEAEPHKSMAQITSDREVCCSGSIPYHRLQELDILREQGIEKVTLVRVTADMAESKRRREEDLAKQER